MYYRAKRLSYDGQILEELIFEDLDSAYSKIKELCNTIRNGESIVLEKLNDAEWVPLDIFDRISITRL